MTLTLRDGLAFAGFHWKYLNLGYNEDVITTWKNEGCFSDITQRLGYRLRLSPTATHNYTSAVRPGTPSTLISLPLLHATCAVTHTRVPLARTGRRFDVSLVLENQGFSAPLHEITSYLVLTSSSYVLHMMLASRTQLIGA
jgi:hypothetical protein